MCPQPVPAGAVEMGPLGMDTGQAVPHHGQAAYDTLEHTVDFDWGPQSAFTTVSDQD